MTHPTCPSAAPARQLMIGWLAHLSPLCRGHGECARVIVVEVDAMSRSPDPVVHDAPDAAAVCLTGAAVGELSRVKAARHGKMKS